MSNWDWIELKEAGEIVTGSTPSTKDSSNYGNYLPFVKPPQLNSNYISEAPQALSEKGAKKARVLPPNSVMVSCIGNLGMVAVNKCKMATNQQINSIIPNEDLDSKFLFYQVQSSHFLNQLDELSSATTVTIVNKGNFSKAKIAVPPLPTQHCIVEKIEELFSDLDNGIENLKKAKQQLETYKQSVLKAAFEGKLTKEWREQQDDLPTPEELRQQIEVERKKYRDQQLKEWEQKVEEWKEQGEPGRKPRKPRKQKTPKKLTAEVLEQLPKIPSNWSWLRFGNIVCESQNGLSKRNSDEGTPVTVLRLSDIENGRVKSNDFRQIKLSDKEIKKYLLDKNDLLFIRVNGSMSLVGRCIRINSNNKAFCDHFIRIKTTPNVVYPKFIKHVFNNIFLRRKIESQFVSTAGQKTISQTNLLNLPLALPTYQEQKEIINSIESKLSVVDQNLLVIDQELQKAEALRQSILKKAFEGKLIKQEPIEEQFQKPQKIYYKNTATDLHAGIMSKIIDAHYQEEKHLKKLNHVKCEKIIHMIEAHEGVDLQREPVKDAAGPDDYTRLKKVEHRADRKNWFAKDDSLGGEFGYGYKPKKGIDYAISDIDKIDGLPLQEIEDMINLFLPMNKEQAEVVATLYAAWNNFLLDGHQPTDEEIIKAARENWSKQKLKIASRNFVKALSWMRNKKLVPNGMGKYVKDKNENKK